MLRLCSLAVILLLHFIHANAQNTLKVGDKAPSISAFKWIKGEKTVTFKEGKVYFVEFGSTWCKPCIAAIPHLTNLAESYAEDVEVISFFVMESNNEPADMENPEYVQKVERFVERQGEKMRYNVAVDDPHQTMKTRWLDAAGKGGIPYAFIVDKKGYIAWIDQSVGTGLMTLKKALDYTLSENYQLQEMVKKAELIQSRTPAYDEKEPLLINGNGGDDHDYMFRSILKKATVRLKAPQSHYFDTRLWFDQSLSDSSRTQPGLAQWVNCQLIDLYRYAYGDTLRNEGPVFRHPATMQWVDEWNPYFKTTYGESWHTPLLEVEHPEKVGAAVWRDRNSKSMEDKYHYSVQVPEEKASAAFVQQVMQRDLKNYFGYDVVVEKREMPYWKLTASSKAKKLLKTSTQGEKYRIMNNGEGSYSFKNAEMKDLIYILGSNFGYRGYDYFLLPPEDHAPFIDETGIDFGIDFELSAQARDSFEVFKDYLESLGLHLQKSLKPMKVIVIRDPQS